MPPSADAAQAPLFACTTQAPQAYSSCCRHQLHLTLFGKLRSFTGQNRIKILVCFLPRILLLLQTPTPSTGRGTAPKPTFGPASSRASCRVRSTGAAPWFVHLPRLVQLVLPPQQLVGTVPTRGRMLQLAVERCRSAHGLALTLDCRYPASHHLDGLGHICDALHAVVCLPGAHFRPLGH